jgi:hypothetical protein
MHGVQWCVVSCILSGMRLRKEERALMGITNSAASCAEKLSVSRTKGTSFYRKDLPELLMLS